jgi:hypothetical protein
MTLHRRFERSIDPVQLLRAAKVVPQREWLGNIAPAAWASLFNQHKLPRSTAAARRKLARNMDAPT